ncbi:MAG TPA: MFS transporter [Burkholderiaceae bacterium]|nr:MFS transporter [Burkholderiaceae bacterium]
MSAAPRSLAPFGALGFAYFASIGLFNPYAPLWFQSLGMSTLAIGTVASLQAWTRVVMPYGWSWLGDHWAHGARRITLLRLAAWLALAAAALLPFTREPVPVTAAVVLVFMANSAIVPLSEASLAQHLRQGDGLDVGRYGRVRLWGSMGFIVSVVLFGALLQRVGIQALPLATVLMFALLVVAAARVPSAQALAATERSAPDGGIRAVLRRREVAWFFAGCFFTVLAHTALYVFFSLYLVSLGYGKGAVGLMWAVSVAAEILFFWRQGRWFARWDAHTWLVIAALVSVLRFAGLALFAGSWPALVALQLLHAVTFAAHHAACISVVDRHFRGPMRGRGQALYTTLGYGISGVAGGVLGGAVAERAGYPAVFAAAAAVALLGAYCCWRSLRSR